MLSKIEALKHPNFSTHMVKQRNIAVTLECFIKKGNKMTEFSIEKP